MYHKKLTLKEKFLRFIEIMKRVLKSFVSPNYGLTIYFGVPGAGKTTLCAYIARKVLKKNGLIWSNVPVKGTFKLSPKEDIGKYLISNGTVLIDEAGLEYNNRDYKQFSQDATEFYKYHRHYRLSVNIFSQGYDDMDKKIRLLATRLFVVSKSALPFLVRRYQIGKRAGINDLTKEICEEYFKIPLSSRWIFSPTLWDMFDSYSTKELPEKQWERW